jgi:hypothetical protein
MALVLVLAAAALLPATAGAMTNSPPPTFPESFDEFGIEPGMGLCRPGHSWDGASWTYLAARANGYVIGNCQGGWTISQRTRARDRTGAAWRGGYVGGDFDGCGWTHVAWLWRRGGPRDGPCYYSRHRQFHSYGVLVNTNVCCDGALVNNPRACDEYANARPWSRHATPLDWLRRVRPHARFRGHSRLKWRYTTRYGHMVMARDRAIAGTRGNWVFVPRSCLPRHLPHGHPVAPGL